MSVFAKFDNENGFFGLTSYLKYAESQLIQSSHVIAKSNTKLENKYEFPWRKIDDSMVEAVGFIPTTFQFNIDQAKILDLLTGHTLYNDSSVAIRELVQNSIDAVRLQAFSEGKDSRESGKVHISWSSATSTLSITDNGTGMTQEIIEKHLLSVGSSRYQDARFREEFPDFHSISRFGIGVLSAFMVADNVQITTVSPQEAEARQISLRSVHGKYLIKLFEKKSPEISKAIGAHGTKVVLRLRSTAEEVDILETLKNWILFPRCNVYVSIDEDTDQLVGFKDPAHAIESFIASEPDTFSDAEAFKVKSFDFGFMKIAFATRYNSHFRDMSLVQLPDTMRWRPYARFVPVGLCIEGIRVEFHPPGFYRGGALLCIADCVGSEEPKTNVSRSALEGRYESVYDYAFEAYSSFIKSEIQRMQDEEGFSLSYAVQQFSYVAQPVFSGPVSERGKSYLSKTFPLFVVEENNSTYAASVADITVKNDVWTVESNAIASLMNLLRDSRARVTARQVVEFCQFDGAQVPAGCLVTNVTSSSIARSAFDNKFEVRGLHAYPTERRLDARWAVRGDLGRWLSVRQLEQELEEAGSPAVAQFKRVREQSRRHGRHEDIRIPLTHDINVVGLDDYVGAICCESVYIAPSSPIGVYLMSLGLSSDENDKVKLIILSDLFSYGGMRSLNRNFSVKYRSIEYFMKDIEARYSEFSEFDYATFLKSASESGDVIKIFNAFSWVREGHDDDEIEF